MTIASDMQADFETILLENGEFFEVKRQTTTKNSLGEVTAVTNSAFRIIALLRDITKKDRQIHEMGLAVPGNRLIYLKPSYTITSGGVATTTNVVKENDILIDRNDIEWRLVQIIKEPFYTDVEIYKKAIVKNISVGDGS